MKGCDEVPMFIYKEILMSATIRKAEMRLR